MEDLIRPPHLALGLLSQASGVGQTTNRYELYLGTVSSPDPIAVRDCGSYYTE